ncbi:MAG: hypothetical protein Q9171_003008 [Xanthocarpia ochracea]
MCSARLHSRVVLSSRQALQIHQLYHLALPVAYLAGLETSGFYLFLAGVFLPIILLSLSPSQTPGSAPLSVSTKQNELRPHTMLPSIAWRPVAASLTIIVIFAYWWLSDTAPSGNNGPTVIQAKGWSGQKILSHQNTLRPIPKKIWQINFNHPRYERLQKSIRSWKGKNPSYEHVVLDDEAGRQYVREHYSHDPYIRNTYLELRSTILRADYLRYLVLAADGGIYSDLDTDAVRPINFWLSGYPDKKIRAMVGIEWDQLGGPTIPEGLYLPLQFCQWSLAFSAHHVLMVWMVQAVTRELHGLAEAHGVSLSDLHPRSDEDVLFTTGPVKWSQEVFAYLSSSTGTQVTHRNFTGLTEPTLVGDVMILPVDSFATGLGHSGSSTTITNATLLRHRFQGTWKFEGKERKNEVG